MALSFDELWTAHDSHRLDPKYHLFEREATRPTRDGWTRSPINAVMRRRLDVCDPSTEPDRRFQVMTIAQTGEIRLREPGKGNNPPEWLGSYLEDM